MDKRYEVYCLVDPCFYDAPAHSERDESRDCEAARRPVPDTWVRAQLGDWAVYRPDGAKLPVQGWKVHVSACLDNAEEILGAVWHYCVPRRIPFKFLPSKDFLFLANAKYAHRGASGKFVTIYPADEAQLHRVLTELDAALHGRPGPYILSDLRWAEGPLYVRYGAFADRYCVAPGGEVVPAIEDGTGQLVPDVRGPTFQVPDWVRLPEFLEPHLADRARTTVSGLPYRIDSALHFSNGGGLYAGVDLRTGERVVLKEARPYAGLTPDGSDAVTRLHREREALERLAGLDCVPAVRDHFMLGDHHFLVEEFIEGSTLYEQFIDRYPLVALEADESAYADYTSWALDIFRKIERAVDAVHERGVVVGDVHTLNALVQPDGRVVLIDFEGASDVALARRQTLAAPGFAAPWATTGFDIDRYALACLRLFLFMPLPGLIDLDANKAGHFAREAARLFPLPPAFLADAVQVINGNAVDGDRLPATDEPRLDPDPQGWERARDSVSAAIRASATPQREDRLFPGDIEQFLTPGSGTAFAHGAAGVLYALNVTGAGRHPQYEDWLVQRALHPGPGTRLGFYEGMHGVAYVLDHLGHRAEAMKVLDIGAGERWDRLGLNLYGGLAGIGLNLLHFAARTDDPAFRDTALQVADLAAGRLGPADSVPEVSGREQPYAGLMLGSSGPALMFVRLYEYTGEAHFLDLAATALRQDLRRCVVRPDGAMEVNEGFRTMPYLADGSVGIGLVLDHYLAHRDDEQFAEAATAIRRAATAPFYIEPGLFDGVAGMILHLSRPHPPGTAAERDPVVAAHIRRLARYVCTYQGNLAFPGEQLMRLSMDLATGSAGVLLAVGSALHHEPVRLPFLAPPGRGGAGRGGAGRSSRAGSGNAHPDLSVPAPTYQKGGDRT
ncbi:class III lanthionine synthetase LanKC [Streptomyces flavidovirens]|uniref:Class III lanthionine synthetase LanKC n=1 Tax=Streptomyces flavidovirens TaxID=67298 RepID=A0ABW6RD46_9ACTN